MIGRIDDASETSSPLTAISRRAAKPKLIACPLSRTTRMPIICLPQVWPLCWPSRIIRAGA